MSTLILSMLLLHELDRRYIPISKSNYLQGGVLGTVVGFGTGHAVQGRWQREGWKHTAWQAGVAAFIAYSFLCADKPSKVTIHDGKERVETHTPPPVCVVPPPDLLLGGLVGIPLLVALRLVEIASVWEPSPDLYRIVSDRHQLPSLAISPLLGTDQAGVQIAWRLK